METSFFTIFDVAIGLLGLYLVYSGLRNYKSGQVDSMVITTEELIKCTDVSGLSKYLMPKEALFGLFCFLFAIQGMLNDVGVIPFSRVVNAAFLVAFLVVWFIFSYYIRQAKKRYIH